MVVGVNVQNSMLNEVLDIPYVIILSVTSKRTDYFILSD
jgi:hypothetical protein